MDLVLSGARVLRDGGWDEAPVGVSGGLLGDGTGGRRVDLSGHRILPGIVDIHGDGFEHHLAPRRGALRDLGQGLEAARAELAANGITTAVLAQFWSWEGGMRGPEFALRFLAALERFDAGGLDLRVQLRLETHLLEDYERFAEAVSRFGVGYVVFNDHLPHAALAKGKRPPRLTGQALKSGRSPEAHLALLQGLHAAGPRVPGAVADLAARLAAEGVRLGSHDDPTAEVREGWATMGVQISEFPETRAAAQAARQGGAAAILGAPNVMRGGSHKGNASAADLLNEGLGEALASDYHYPRRWPRITTTRRRVWRRWTWWRIWAGNAPGGWCPRGRRRYWD